MHLGSWDIDDLLTFPAQTFSPTTNEPADADGAPAYRVYEDETATPILTGTMATLDAANTDGFYSEQITLSAANGLESGKSYTIRIFATVGGVDGVLIHTFQIGAKVNAGDGSGFTDIPWNAAEWDTPVENAATAAIAAADFADKDEVADAVWDEARAGHVAAGSFGEYIDAPISGASGATIDEVYAAVFRAPAVVHVNKVTGNDTTGDGTYAAPYATIGKANEIGIIPLGATILIWPGADSGDEYAESTELLDTREVYLMRGVIVQPAAGFCFWIDSQLVSIRGEGILLPPANEPAVQVSDGHPDISGVAIQLNNTGSLAVRSNNSAAIILKEVHIEGQVAAGSNPAAFFESETTEPAHISINNSTIVYDSSGRKSLTIGYGYPGLWDTATHVGSVGLVATGISTDAITAAKVAADQDTAAAAAVRTNLTTELGRIDAAVSTRASQTSVDSLPDDWGASIIGDGRSRDYFLQGGANRIAFAADGLTFTVYSTDDLTPLYTGTSTRHSAAVGGLRSVDPA